MGLKQKQLGGVLGAYFRGVNIPRLLVNANRSGLNQALAAGAPGNMGVGAFRMGAAGAAGLAAWNIGSGSDIFAGAAAAGAFYGAYRGLGGVGALSGTPGRTVARGAIGLMAGSIAWQGLRGPRMSDYA